jgi:uncharacterized protein (DUF4213/DUF364 family)
MVIDETINLIRELYREHLQGITVDRLIAGIFFTGVKLSNNLAGISYTPTADIHQEGGCIHVNGVPREPYHFKGLPVSDFLDLKEEGMLLRTVQIVILNALSVQFFNGNHYQVIEERDPMDLLDLRGMQNVAMVGAIPPFLKRLKKEPHLKIHLIERKKDSLAEDEIRLLVPEERITDILPRCDAVIITGAAIANGTMETLLDLTPEDATVIVAGPTAGLLPDALFARGVSIVSTVVVPDPDRALDLLAEGNGAFQLFAAKCLRKINILSSAYGLQYQSGMMGNINKQRSVA